MSQRKFEDLSAFMDGASQDDKFLDDLLKDVELAQKWQSYHLIRDGLRKDLPNELQIDISVSVAEAIAQEPSIVAPKKSKVKIPFFGEVVPLVRQGGQFAVAATVAVAVILGYQQFNQPIQEQPFSSAPIVPVAGIQGGLSPVSLEQTRTVPRNDLVEQRRRLNAYLSDHKQQIRSKSLVEQPDSATANEQQDKDANSDSEQK